MQYVVLQGLEIKKDLNRINTESVLEDSVDNLGISIHEKDTYVNIPPQFVRLKDERINWIGIR